jgi:hypothetical protein
MVGRVDDSLEHEADRIADQVMRITDPTLSFPTVHSQINPQEEQQTRAQPKSIDAPHGDAGEAPNVVYDVLRSPGQPLDRGVREFMEPRLRHDLSKVRIHTDRRAEESARSMNALAYTVGTDVVFAAEHYAPASFAGRRLLAHELVHVLQQGGINGTVREVQRAQAEQPLFWWHMTGPPVLDAKRKLNLYHQRERSSGHPGFGKDWQPLTENDFVDDRMPPALGMFQRQMGLKHRDSRLWQETLDALNDIPLTSTNKAPQDSTASNDTPRELTGEVEAPSLEQVPQDQSAGVNLPAVSKEAADPQANVDYIDRRVTAVGYGIYDGFMIFCGLSQPINVSERLMYFGGGKYESASSEIFDDYGTASKQLPYGPPAPGAALPYAYFRVGNTGVIAPTTFSSTTTPRIVKSGWAAAQELKRQVQTELVYIALSIIGGMAVRALAAPPKIVGSEVETKPPTPTEPTIPRSIRPRATLQQLREMIANDREYFTFRTPDADVAANQPVKYIGENTPATHAEHARVSNPPPQQLYLGRGVEGLPYGRYAVCIKGANYRITASKEPMEFLLDGEIPADDGVWYTHDDYLAAKGTIKSNP